MILLWGLPADRPFRAVRDALTRIAAPLVVLDQRRALECGVQLEVTDGIAGHLLLGDRHIDLASITAAYLRPYDSRRLPQVRRAGRHSPEWRHVLRCSELLWTWADLVPALVINRPRAMASNCSKPYQATTIRAAGFEVPDTLITTESDAVHEFLKRHDAVIYKSISSVRSIVSRLTPARLEELEAVAWCPTQFQELVPGLDYRVHVVGSDVFVSRVVSSAVDYRYAGIHGEQVEIHPTTIPEDCALRCLRLARQLGLHVAGIDLRLTPDERWYCFEVNPSPGFAYYDRDDGVPIARAIARLLSYPRLGQT